MKKILSRLLLSFMLTAGILAFAKTDIMAETLAVTGLKQNADYEHQVGVEWKPVKSSTLYEIKYRIPGAADVLKEYDLNRQYSDTAVDKMLKEGKINVIIDFPAKGAYCYISIRANVDGVWGPYSDEIEAVIDPRFTGPIEIDQTKATKTSASFKWTAVPGANRYKVEYGTFTKRKVKHVSTNSLTVSGLQKGKYQGCMIRAYRQSAQGYKTAGAYAFGHGEIALVPNKKLSITELYFYPDEGTLGLRLSYDFYSHSECQLYTAYKKKDTKIAYKENDIELGETGFEFKKNALKYDSKTRIYKYKIRSFRKADNGKKYSLGWTDWKYFTNTLKAWKLRNKKGGGIEITWKKVLGADGYKIYAHTDKEDMAYYSPESMKSKYLVATVKNGNTVKATFKKYQKRALQPGRMYYAFVVPQKRVNGKLVPVKVTNFGGDIPPDGIKYRRK